MQELDYDRLDLPTITRKMIKGFLLSKEKVQTIRNYHPNSQKSAVNILRIIHVFKAVGFIYFLDAFNFIYLGTNKTILNYVKFAQDKITRFEAENQQAGKDSIISGDIVDKYQFRSPIDFRNSMKQNIAIGSFEFNSLEFQLLGDFVEQLVMEMLFDPSYFKR